MLCREADPNRCLSNVSDELNSNIGKVPPTEAVLCLEAKKEKLPNNF
jgi:hypothetical protein